MAKEKEVKKKSASKPAPKKTAAKKKTETKETVPAAKKVKKATVKKAAPAKKQKKAVEPVADITSAPEPVKVIMKEEKTLPAAKKAAARKTPVKKAVSKPGSDSDTDQSDIEALKYFTPKQKAVQNRPAVSRVSFTERDEYELDDRYEDNKVVLMARDPHWCYVYWDISSSYMKSKTEAAAATGENYSLVVRVYDITDVVFDGTNSHRFVDIKVSGDASNWYVNVWSPGRTYLVDLGFKTDSGKFIMIARSNTAGTPADAVSEESGEEWAEFDEDFEGLFKASGGGRQTGSGSEGFMSPLELNLSSGNVSSFSSPGVWGGGAPENKKARKFFLVADTELILYGATEPDAVLRVKGEIVRLNEDGTFSMRFHLPNGVMQLPVEAESADGIDKKSIKFTVEKKTE